MLCHFYRPETRNTREFDAICKKLEEDLSLLGNEPIDTRELNAYVGDLLRQAEPLEKDPRMYFLGFDKPENMDGDCRVEYFYRPTYLATAFVMKSLLLFPHLLDEGFSRGGATVDRDGAFALLSACMLGCTGRRFAGHGYDDVKGLVETMGLFAENGAAQFIGQHPDLCPEFNECFAQAADFLRRDAVRGAWGDDYTERAHEIAKTIDRETQRLYLAYGSNLNVAQMNFRCPDAKIVGTAELKDHRLMFKGSGTGNYLTVEPESGCAVPVAVWSVSEADEASLDRYEGFPRFYYKKNVTLEMLERESGQTRTVNAFVYVMHEDRELGAPRDDYYERCMEGYEHFGFDPQLLAEAREYSSRK